MKLLIAALMVTSSAFAGECTVKIYYGKAIKRMVASYFFYTPDKAGSLEACMDQTKQAFNSEFNRNNKSPDKVVGSYKIGGDSEEVNEIILKR